VIGVDTPSTDSGQTPGYECHTFLQPNNVILIEYVANLDSLPLRNTTIVIGAPKFRDSTGSPSRILAFVDDDDDDDVMCASNAAYISSSLLTILYMVCCCSLLR